MRSRDLIDGFDYNEHMQRQMFCFGSSDDTDSGADSESTYSGGLDFDEEFSGDYGPSTSSPSVGGGGGGGGNDPYDDEAFDLAPVATAAAVAAGQLAAAQQAARQNLAESITAENVARAVAGQPIVNTMESPYQSTMTPQEMMFAPTSYDLSSQAINNLGVARGGERSLAGLTREQYGAMPGYMQSAYDKAGAYNFEFGPQGRVTGFYGPPGGSPFPMANLLGKGIVGLTNALLGPPMTEEDLALRSVYTGFGEGSKPDGGRDNEPRPPVKSVNPVTGQCDEGYIFDEDLQACRMDTSSGATFPVTTPPTFSPGAYARMGLLDQTPQGLLQVAGQPYDFDAANKAFRMATATRPEYYSDPYDLKGYTLLA